MKKNKIKKTGWMMLTVLVLAVSSLSSAGADIAYVPPSSEATFKDISDKKVSLELNNGTVSDALFAVSKQAEIPLAISAEQDALQKSFTLMGKDKPAGEVLEIIANTTDLVLENKNGILVVRSKPRDTSAEAPRPSASRDEKGDSDEGAATSHRGFQGWKERFENHDRFWKKRKEVVEFNRPVIVSKEDHFNSAVSIGSNTVVEGHLDKDAVSLGGNVTVKSGAVVEGSAVAIGGNVIVEPGAVVGDDAVAVGGTVEVADNAVLEGDRVSIGIPLPPMGSIAGAIGGILLLNALSAIARSIILFAIALLLIWLVPKRVDTVRGYLNQKLGISILSGFLLFLALIPLFIVLAITIIGIPLIPVAAVALIALMLLGLTAVLAWLGERAPLFKNKQSSIKVLAIGFLVFLIINVIPFLGGVFMMLAMFAGVGAAFQSRFGGRDLA